MDYNKITQNTYDNISENWDEKRQYYWEPVKEFLSQFPNQSKLSFLDLGCGTGRFLELAKELGFKKQNIIGCDYSKGQLEIVKQKGFNTMLGDLQKLTFENESFNVIICIAAHHHLLEKKEQLHSLKEMKRILKPNGKILISEWFPEKEYIKKQIEKEKFEFLDEKKQMVKVTYTLANKKFDRYYYLFKEIEIIQLCQKANLKIEKKEYFKGNLYLTLIPSNN